VKFVLSSATFSRRRGIFVGALCAIAVAAIAWLNLAGSQGLSSKIFARTTEQGPIKSGNQPENINSQQGNLQHTPTYQMGRSPIGLGAAPNALLRTSALARTIEDLIGEAFGGGNMRDDPHGFRSRLAERVRKHFSGELADPAVAFVNRYLNYLESLDALNLPSAAHDPAALRSVFDARQSLRQAFFSPEEYDALFARDDRLDRYTLARFEIQADAKLSLAEKTEALNAAANELSPDERKDRAQWQAHLTLQRQTALFDEKQTSEQERFAARSNEYGEAAAQRLAELDRTQREWDERLAQYESALVAHRSGKLANEALTATRDQLFNERERLRLDAALSLRAKQNKS
jgi:lipase chaperone LimK